MKLVVVLGTSEEVSFDIELYSNSFVHKWLDELKWCQDNCKFNQDEVFSGLLTLDQSVTKLQSACVIINKYLKNFIDLKPDLLNQPQDYFNYLHLKFEQLSGEFNKPTRLFTIANDELKTAIRNLNFYIHRVEQKINEQKIFYISFDKDRYRRQSLNQTDYDFFEFKFDPGTLFVHYVELGKDLYDLYKDNLPIDYKMAKNLHYYSGEASLSFYSYDIFQDQSFVNWLYTNKLNPYDKKLGHGKIPLGKILDLNSVYSKIKNYRYLNKILIKD